MWTTPVTVAGDDETTTRLQWRVMRLPARSCKVIASTTTKS